MTAPMLPRKAMRTEMYLTDRWVDVSDDVRQQSGVSTTYGSSSHDRSVPPATLTEVLENESNRYSPRNPLSTNYGKLGANTLTRVTCGITEDLFGRTVSGSFGSSTRGDLWSSFGGSASDYNVTPGTATHLISSTSSSRLSYMPGQLHRNVDVAVTFSLALSNVTGGDLEPANLVVRGVSTSDYIMVRVVITSAEVITIKVMHVDGTNYSSAVTVPITFSGQTFRVRAQAEGSAVRAKLWVVDTSVPESDGEPIAWAVEAQVPLVRAGWPGFRSGVASGNTNTPVTFTYRNFELRSARFIGEAARMSPRWNLAESDRTVALDGAGLLQRLQTGAAPLKSTLRRSIPSLPDLVAYWPMEDGPEATSFASAVPGGIPMYIDPGGDQTLSAFDGFPSSEPLPTVNFAIMIGPVSDYTGTGEIQARFLMHMTEDGVADNTPICRVWTKGGTLAYWEIRGGLTPGSLVIAANNGSSEVLTSSLGFDLTDLSGRISMELKQNGANIDWGLWFLEVGASSGGGFTGTLNSHTLGVAHKMDFSLTYQLNGIALGHATVEKKVTSIFDLLSQLNAYNGETATTRMIRLCGEEGVTFSLNGSVDPDAKMGYQRLSTLVDLLKECADLDMGILGESRGVLGLKYRTRLSMLNQVPVVSIDRAAGQLSEPFLPVDDNRLTANAVTAERTGGSSYLVEQTTGPMSIEEPPVGAGRIPNSKPEFNAFSDLQLPDLAGWTLALGTIDDYRYPSVAADMAVNEVERDAELVAGLLSLDIGDLVVVTGLSPLGIYDDVLQIAHGYAETIFPHKHVIQANTFPASPYSALKLDDAALGKADSESSTTNASFSSSALSFTVASNTNDLWTTDGAEFPIDVLIAGERIRLSGISGATSPQTFTVAAGGRSINGVVKAHASGEPVHIATPVRLA